MLQKRFYESDPVLQEAVRHLLLFPDGIQTILASGISNIIEQNDRTKEHLHESKTLGREKILALYKSHGKQRSYDNNPAMHKLMNDLMMMDSENRQSIAKQMIELIQCIPLASGRQPDIKHSEWI
jgi:hypothetical protein